MQKQWLSALFLHQIKPFLLVHIFLHLILVLFSQSVGAQDKRTIFTSITSEQLGYGIKIQAEIGGKKDPLNWRIALSAGAGAFLIKDVIYPSLQADLMLYHGGLGSKWPGDKTKDYFDAELVIGYTLTAGAHNRMKYASKLSPVYRNYPLYYFNTYAVPSLQNPYNYSASWGGNVIFFFTGANRKSQHVGFLNVHIDRFQFSYANDGPPFFPPFGDKYDRWHTGIGFLSLHGDVNWDVDLLEMGFNKFTGYSKNAYELSNRIGTGYNFYKDESQQFYNKSQLYLNLGSTRNNWMASINSYNTTRGDVQHKIHQNLFYPLHMVPYQGHFSLGGALYFKKDKIGLR